MSILMLNTASEVSFIKNRLEELENNDNEERLKDFLSVLSWIHLFFTENKCLRLVEDYFLNFLGRKDFDMEDLVHCKKQGISVKYRHCFNCKATGSKLVKEPSLPNWKNILALEYGSPPKSLEKIIKNFLTFNVKVPEKTSEIPGLINSNAPTQYRREEDLSGMDVAVTTSTFAPTSTISSNAITPSPINFRVIPSMCEKNVRFELTKLCNKWWDFYMKKTKKFCLHCYIFTSEIVEVTAVHRCSPMNTLAKRCFDCLSSSHSYRNELCYKIGNKVKDFSSGWGEGIRFCFICSLPQVSLKHRHFTVPCHTPFRQYISPA
ncbi:hypothetical protein HK099_003251, partial [Clydaea vesicula]